MADPPNSEFRDCRGAPRWVKVFGIIIAVVVLLLVILMLTRGPGGHGPDRHAPSGDAGRRTPASRLTEDHPPSSGDRHDRSRPERGH